MVLETSNCVNFDAGNSNVVHLRPLTDHTKRGDVVKADLDDGYLRLSNTLVDALCCTKLSDRESRVVFAVMRRTYGYGKATDWVCLEQLAEMTGISTSNICHAIRSLTQRNILIKDGRKLGVNTVVSEWSAKLSKPENSKKSVVETDSSIVGIDNAIVEIDSPDCRNREIQKKDNITKDNINNICPKSAFNPFFKIYPAHRKGGSDAHSWKVWKAEKLTEADCEAAILWLTQAAAADVSWQTHANGQYALGITRFIRERHWLTPLPKPAVHNSHLDIAVYHESAARFDSVSSQFNTEL
ncbi:replication protein [Shewanella mangrovisoli]|uniref:replication protein n=1 Tax=Shewanella mangrovisoli TaxID=2864211 RepID=UPI00313B56AE